MYNVSRLLLWNDYSFFEREVGCQTLKIKKKTHVAVSVEQKIKRFFFKHLTHLLSPHSNERLSSVNNFIATRPKCTSGLGWYQCTCCWTKTISLLCNDNSLIFVNISTGYISVVKIVINVMLSESTFITIMFKEKQRGVLKLKKNRQFWTLSK